MHTNKNRLPILLQAAILYSLSCNKSRKSLLFNLKCFVRFTF